MIPGRRILVGGGVRSGKSTFALRLARSLGARRAFVATAERGDQEMAHRIACHSAERGDEFLTVEVPREVPEAIASLQKSDVVVLDCITFWIANLLMAEHSESDILAEVVRLDETLRSRSFHFIGVTNEVGMGVVPDSALGRSFRDVVGRAHQRLSTGADEVYFGAMGLMLRLAPSPVVVMERPS